MHILLVEDDPMLGKAVLQGLAIEGHQVIWVTHGDEAEQRALDDAFDVILLDLGLPGRSGLDVLKSLREKGNTTPVLILTARDSVDDRVRGLDLGADDYMTKPFDLTELCARLRVIKRRLDVNSDQQLTYGDIELNVLSHQVLFQGSSVILPRREFVLLQMLMENVGRVLSKQQIESKLYGFGTEVESNTVEVHIHNLRKRFGNQFIRTLRGVGYLLE